MMIKQLKTSGVVAWSPIKEHPHLLASATAANSIGDFTATSQVVELYSLTTSDPQDRTMPEVGSVEASERFNCLTWGKIY